MRPVEKAIPALSVPVGDSDADVLGLDAVVLGDGGVSAGAVGRYVSVGDVSVSGIGDPVGCCVDKVLSGAVSGGLRDLDRVSGGGDTDVCGVDKVLSGAVSGVCVTLTGCREAVTRMCVVRKRCCRVLSVGVCDLDRVSGGGDTEVCCVDTVLSGAVGGGMGDLDRVSEGGDLAVCVVVSGVDESVCGVNPVMTAGVLDLCGVDAVMSGVDRFVCSVSMAMTAGESDVCGGDRVVSGETGESSEVDVFVSGDDVVVCGDDTLLTVCRWLVTPCCVGLE